MDILNTFIGKVLDFTLVPVGRQFGYVLFYNSNIKGLNEEAEKLEAARKDVESSVSAARGNNRVIGETVLLWQRTVDEIIGQAGKLFQEERHANTGCSHKSCPNLRLRYKLSRKAKKIALEVKQLNGEWKIFEFDKFPIIPIRPQGIGESSVVRGTFESRVSTMNEIMEALADPAVHLIGLYGHGGVGKTTLADQLFRKAQEEKMFEKVVFVCVKQYRIKEIQSQIACSLGFFDLKDDSEAVRAGHLHQRLEQEKSLLIVLDDLWERLDFKLVGIPSADKPETRRKFIFTSRDARLLSSQMNCKRNIKVELLSEEEAWMLLKEMAEINEHSDDPDVVLKAKEVSKKCARLPVAIVAVARALRNNKSLVDWEEALRRLSSYSSRNTPEIEEVDSSIKLSYHYLPKELQPIFLLSAMLSQDPLVIDLLTCAVGLGFLESVHNMEEAWVALHALVNRLKDSSLLLDSYSNDRFTMHDVVRDVALSIAFEEQRALVRRCVKVDEWPNEYRPESCTAICLDESDIDELPEELTGPKVKFFYLNIKDPKLNIPINFFKGMQELKVLSLSNMTFSSLPSSINLLRELVTLSLCSCKLEDMSVIGYLEKLKILNLSHSRIKQLPCEVGQLCYLKVLNLSNCCQLEVIPPNILSNLKKLEELYMKNSFNQWEVEGLDQGKRRASLSELKHLQKLATLEIEIPRASVLPKDLFLDNSLKRYKIYMQSHAGYYLGGSFSRTLALEADNINMEYGVFRLLENVEGLLLEKLNGIASLYQSHITAQIFCKLRAILVRYCDQLRYLFSVSMVETLSRLETIEARRCKSLQEIVTFIDGENVQKGAIGDVIEFLQLRSLTLFDLPSLTYFSSNKVVAFPNLETLILQSINCQNIWDVLTSKSNGTGISEIVESSQSFGNLKTLTVANCNFILKLIPFDVLKSLGNLEELNITGCDLLEVVFDLGEFNNHKEIYTFRLKKLVLQSLPKLETLCSRGTRGIINFQNLQKVWVLNCKSLKSIFPAFLAKGLSQLEELVISYCEAEVVVAKDEFPLDADATVVFPKLRIVKIKDCTDLKIFDSELSDILDEKVAFPNLETLELESIKYRNIWDKLTSKSNGTRISEILESSQMTIMPNNPLPDGSFGKLKTMTVAHCNFILRLIPFHILKSLGNLEKLMIESCNSLEVVFDLGEFNNDEEIYTFRLKELDLEDLPNLKTVWSRGTQGIINFHSLQNVIVRDCRSLKSIFPASIAKGLIQLEKLSISYCGAEVVVAKDEFPLEADATVVFPKLRIVKITDCNDLKIFESELSDRKYSLFLDEKVIPKLEELSLNGRHAMMMCTDKFRAYHFLNAKILTLSQIEIIPYGIGFPKLDVSSHSSEVIFSGSKRPLDNDASKATLIEGLVLRSLNRLKYIWYRNCQADHTLQNLKTLKVIACRRLISLGPSFVSLENLTELDVFHCDELINLFTPSTARTLVVQLTRLRIEQCGKIEEIITDEQEDMEKEIHFMKLKILELHGLSGCKSFCSHNYSFNFLLLDEVVITRCPRLRMFCLGDLTTPLLKVKMGGEEIHCQNNLNEAIQLLFDEKETQRQPHMSESSLQQLPANVFCLL